MGQRVSASLSLSLNQCLRAALCEFDIYKNMKASQPRGMVREQRLSAIEGPVWPTARPTAHRKPERRGGRRGVPGSELTADSPQAAGEEAELKREDVSSMGGVALGLLVWAGLSLWAGPPAWEVHTRRLSPCKGIAVGRGDGGMNTSLVTGTLLARGGPPLQVGRRPRPAFREEPSVTGDTLPVWAGATAPPRAFALGVPGFPGRAFPTLGWVGRGGSHLVGCLRSVKLQPWARVTLFRAR